MRIFILNADPGIAPDGTKGAAVHLRAIGEALSRSGNEVTLFSKRLSVDSGRFAFPVRAFEGPASLVAAVADLGVPAFVHERYALGHEDGLAAARTIGVPHVLEVNAPLVLEARRHRPDTVSTEHEAAEQRLFRGTDLLCAVSNPLLDHAAAIRGTRHGTLLLRNGCESALFEKPVPTSQDDEPILVFIGHPKPWHGAARLPRLLRTLLDDGFSPRLLMLGGGEGTTEVMATARTLGVDSRIEITGPVTQEEVARRLQEGTLLVAPYPKHDFFYFCPLKVIEAMAAGLPVVCTDQGDVRDILGDGGKLVAPDDDHGLARAVAALLAAPRERHVLGMRGRARALGSMTWDHVAARLLAAVGATTARTPA